MKYTLTITEDVFNQLADVVFAIPGVEGAAYLLCGISRTESEIRLLAREVVPVQDEHYQVREADRLSILSDSYVAVAKRSRSSGVAILFAHSHPEDHPDFSSQDDREEQMLMTFFKSRSPSPPHGSMVLSSRTSTMARIWADGVWKGVERIRVLGRRFRFIDRVLGQEPLPDFFARQVLTFGPDIQRLLGRLHVGVVGAGGTGSAVIEQLTRLGVGTLSVFDGDVFERSNVTRVYGSSVLVEGTSKVTIQEVHVKRIGLGTHVHVFPRPITEEATARHLRECDVVFGCTDKQTPRGILGRLSTYYLLPCFDIAVKVHPQDGKIRGIWGRVTTLICGEACLLCRGTIDPGRMRAESLPPEQRDRELEEGYITGLATDEPAVVSFTTAVAAQAVNELLHRLSGFMGEERVSTEVLILFHKSRVRTNRQPPNPDCVCQQHERWGVGDTRNYLGLVWPA